MPIDLEMLLSQSPPLFDASAFIGFRYGPFDRPQRHHLGTYRQMSPPAQGQDDPKGGKKRVWFADDKGLALTHVRIMSEPSNCPPRWSDEFLAHVTQGIVKKKQQAPAPTQEWALQFAQPASDYLAFRNKVQQNCVSLENVIIREGDDTITGTIKVKNIAFDKEVFIRITFDRWQTSTDVPATFVPSGVEAGSSMFDTFSFVASIPQSASKTESAEFCVGFRTSGAEHWDNNGGDNYKLTCMTQKSAQQQVVNSYDLRKQCKDALQVNLDAWSEFASWSHLITDGPYW